MQNLEALISINNVFHGHFSVFGIEIGMAPRIVISVVAILFTWFVLRYVLAAVFFLIRGGSLVRKISKLGKGVDPETIQGFVKSNKKLAHLWAEYAESLHEQWETVDGERRRVKVRATMPAEMFFRPEILVDSRLATEFFKHLPGMLTGIGIIGTFYGLITGLDRFNLQLDPQLLQVSIANLMGAVKEAFIASGVAISAAMVVTLLEKLLLTRCYRVVERLTSGYRYTLSSWCGRRISRSPGAILGRKRGSNQAPQGRARR